VNFSDFQKLLDNWNPVGFSDASVHEPATLSLLALGGLGMLRRRK
jgi:MYXO-CTERM domain-containing protein